MVAGQVLYLLCYYFGSLNCSAAPTHSPPRRHFFHVLLIASASLSWITPRDNMPDDTLFYIIWKLYNIAYQIG